MLNCLLAIKARRERRLRMELVRLAQEIRMLDARRDAVRQQRVTLRQERCALLDREGVLNQRSVAALRTALEDQRHSERDLLVQLQQLAQSHIDMESARAQLTKQLRQVQLEQEKLSMMMATL